MKEPRKPRRLRRDGGRAGDPLLLRVGARHPAWRRHAWRLLALWGVVLAAYYSSFQAGLILDSPMVISQDARIQAVTPENLPLILTEEYWHGCTRSVEGRVGKEGRF